MLEENYNHLDIEDKIYAFWESNKLFEPKKNNKKKYFSIVIPPPNVTGNYTWAMRLIILFKIY